MKSFRGRPVITDQDHPATVYAALHESIPYWHKELPDEATTWVKTANDSWETLADEFRVDLPPELRGAYGNREAVLYMSPDQLELALVAYGVHHITNQQEVGKINQLLTNLDGFRADHSL